MLFQAETAISKHGSNNDKKLKKTDKISISNSFHTNQG